jgi:hypothetical protein
MTSSPPADPSDLAEAIAFALLKEESAFMRVTN